MKFKKILAAVAAAAVAVSMTAVNAFATVTNEMYCILSDDENVPVFSTAAEIEGVTSFTITFTSDVDLAAKSAAGEWYNFGIIINANSTGWKSMEANISESAGKQYVIVPTGNAGEYKIEHKSDTPVFAATDTYAQIWLQDWSNDKTGTYTVTSVELFDADGNVVTPAPAPAADDTTAAEGDDTAATTEADDTAATTEADDTAATTEADDTAATTEADDTAATTEADDTAATTEATETAPAADATTTATNTGNVAVASIAAVMAIAGAAAIATKKRN